MKHTSNIKNMTNAIISDEKKLLEINELCFNNQPKSAYELLDLYYSVSQILNEFCVKMDFLISETIKDNNRTDRLECLKHISIASMLSLPIILFGFMNKLDLSEIITFASMDLAASISAAGIYDRFTTNHKLFLSSLDENAINTAINNICILGRDCLYTLSNKINEMEKMEDVNESTDMVESIVNATIIKTITKDGLNECLMLPCDAIEEIVNTLKKDLNTEEEDIVKLVDMARAKLNNKQIIDEKKILKRKKK